MVLCCLRAFVYPQVSVLEYFIIRYFAYLIKIYTFANHLMI